MTYTKTLFAIIVLASWWLVFLNISFFAETDILSPSLFVYLQFLVFIFFFISGGYSILFTRSSVSPSFNTRLVSPSRWYRFFLRSLFFLFFGFLLYSLWKEGAFDSSFSEYFLLKRGGGGDNENSLVDSILIFFGLPVSLFFLIKNEDVMMFRLSILFVFIYAYLYQVNYVLIYMVVIFALNFFFYTDRSLKKLFPILLFGIVLTLAAINRFGDVDLLGVFDYYFLNYHIIGFTFYDHMFNDNASPLHDRTYGVWSLGSLLHLPSIVLSKLGFDWPLSLYDAYGTYISNDVDLGRYGPKSFNAFNTLLATFYKDFGLLGFLVPPFLYGLMVAYSFRHSLKDSGYKAIFITLSLSWIVGFMISPIERPMFWILIVLIVIDMITSKNSASV